MPNWLNRTKIWDGGQMSMIWSHSCRIRMIDLFIRITFVCSLILRLWLAHYCATTGLSIAELGQPNVARKEREGTRSEQWLYTNLNRGKRRGPEASWLDSLLFCLWSVAQTIYSRSIYQLSANRSTIALRGAKNGNLHKHLHIFYHRPALNNHTKGFCQVAFKWAAHKMPHKTHGQLPN